MGGDGGEGKVGGNRRIGEDWGKTGERRWRIGDGKVRENRGKEGG